MKRTLVLIAAVGWAACPAKSPTNTPNSGTAAGSGSGSAAAPAKRAAPAPAACRPARVKLGISDAWVADGAAHACLRATVGRGQAPVCVRYAQGRLQRAKPRARPAPKPAFPQATFKGNALEVCKAQGQCKTFRTRRPARDTGAAVNAAGTRAAAVTFVSKNKSGTNVKLATEVYDVEAGKLIARVATPAVGDNPCVEARFLGDDYLALPGNNCAGPAGATQVVDIAQGKRVVIERPAQGKAAAGPLDTYDFAPLHTGRALYAFLGDYGATLVLYDLSIGKRTGALDLRPYFVASKDLAPQLDPPEQLKHAAYVAVDGDVVVFLGSPSRVMRGDKAVAPAAGQPGTVLLLDGRTASLRATLRLPVCR